ncbi:MAG: primosomal protein N' [Verrucomicrobiae bacterium]|nr:primosomal protein N' [Verrucomicrobiae bacterium]
MKSLNTDLGLLAVETGISPPAGEICGVALVRVDMRINKEFHYLIPRGLKRQVQPGARVHVPFGNRRILGTVLKIESLPLQSHGDIPPLHELKPIRDVLGDTPVITTELMRLAEWMAGYYLTPLDLVLRSVTPAVVQKRSSMREVAPRTDPELETAAAEILPSRPLPLTTQQKLACEQILAATGQPHPKPILLHGVTGSGKTEVYLQAMAHILKEGRGAIMLVPEIALTPQTIERLRSRFMDETGAARILAVLHSSLSDGERFREWQRIRKGEARLVVGARSAVFAPVQRLGLIVVDEEHEQTYKQEKAPHYHARDIAVMRGHLEGAAVTLGSATPCLESYHNARTGKYQLCRMSERIDNRRMPTVRIVDMRGEISRNPKNHVISAFLLSAIRARLDRGEQVILYLNRRGYATSLICKKCGYVAMCPHCSITLAYHLQAQKLTCHFCGCQQPAPRVCPSENCRDPAIRFSGTGTEKLEELVAALFPKARVARMDSDVMTHRHDYERTLLRFKMGKIDILLGTQMIAKGLDFPRVTLVGIINADVGLHMPDFRGGERVFQQITQVAGRAGRGDIEGEVLVQTFTPEHPAIRFARLHDFEGLYHQETLFRKELDYPPFNHLTQIECSSEKPEHAELAAARLRQSLEEKIGSSLRILGPCPAPLSRLRDKHRVHLLLRDSRNKRQKQIVREILASLPRSTDVLITANVDPLNML